MPPSTDAGFHIAVLQCQPLSQAHDLKEFFGRWRNSNCPAFKGIKTVFRCSYRPVLRNSNCPAFKGIKTEAEAFFRDRHMKQ